LNRQIRDLHTGLAAEQGIHQRTQEKLDNLKAQSEQKDKDINNLQDKLNKAKEQLDKLNKKITDVSQEARD